MITKRCITLLVPLALIAGTALAADRPVSKGATPRPSTPAKWDKEPDSFLGIRFGAPFPGDLTACPTSGTEIMVDAARTKALGTLCYVMSWRDNTFDLFNLPALGIGYEVQVRTVGGNAGEFRLKTGSSAYPKLRDIFFERYGNPASSNIATVTTGAGGKFSSENSTWAGPDVAIFLQQLTGDINTSTATLWTTAMQKAVEEAQARSKASAASKL